MIYEIYVDNIKLNRYLQKYFLNIGYSVITPGFQICNYLLIDTVQKTMYRNRCKYISEYIIDLSQENEIPF